MSRSVRWPSPVLAGLVVPLLAAGCFTPNIAADPKAPDGPGSAFKETSAVQCSSVRPQTEPDLMAWDPGSRANLSRLREEGAVAVRYSAQGCNVELELLPECIGVGATYAYRPYAETQSKIARNAQELYAELPIGAAHLSGKLAGERAIRTDYMLVGTASMPVAKSISRSDLTGQGCDRATHVISSIYLGGFAMMAGQKSNIQAQASVFGGYSGGESGERLDSAGDPEACSKAAKSGVASPQCSVPLRIGLRALEDVKGVTAGSSVPAALPATNPPPAPAAAPASPPTVASARPAPAPPPGDLMGAIKASANKTRSLLQTSGPIEFETGKSTLRPASEKVLDTVATTMLQQSEIKRLSVEVHSDSAGDDKYNLQMTEARAKAVVDYLVRKGVPVARLAYEGFGETKPVAENTTAEGRAKNRRVELMAEK